VFIVGDIPEALEAEDGVAQTDVERIIALDRCEREEFIQGFHDQQVKRTKLSTLRMEYERGMKRTSIHRLRQRQVVEVDADMLLKQNDAEVAWGARDHFLDYYLLVPGRKGMHAILPNSRGDPSYMFKLDLHRRRKRWQARHADLEFDPRGRMLFIGAHGREEVWLAMVPRSFTREDAMDIEDNEDPQESIGCLEGADTTMSEEQYCQIVVFLANQLKAQGYRDIYLREDFPSTLSALEIRNTTNLL
jgi:hypothetical protein